MNSSNNVVLLRQFAETRSEHAFTELVKAYGPVVYSVAHRITGTPDLALDVAQRVFVDLITKTSRLRLLLDREPNQEAALSMLLGWFHRAARFEALELVRSETRRKNRERIAMESQTQQTEPEQTWEAIRPELDEALDSLEETDRRAILLRFFQGAAFREIGAAFGISDDAAQKRVSRALDRLREFFVRKGIATSVALLGASLSNYAVEPMPSTALARIAAVSAGVSTFAPRYSAMRRLMIAGAIATFIGVVYLWTRSPKMQVAVEGPSPASVQSPPVVTEAVAQTAALTAPTPALAENELKLHVVSTETGAPLAGVFGSAYISFDQERAFSGGILETDSEGNARLGYTNGLAALSIELSLEGYACTRLAWKLAQGQAIPSEYTLRMASAPRIGGFVVDEQGTPVENAWVQFSLPDKYDGPIAQVESFYAPFHPQIHTDANGYWESTRIAREILPRLEGTPARQDFLSHDWLKFSSLSNGVEQLLARTFTFELRRGIEIRGTLVDEQQRPVPDVPIAFGSYYTNQRWATSGLSGEFVLKACLPGRQIVSAVDHARGSAFHILDVSSNTEPFTLTLQPFRTLRIRTEDSTGAPVAAVHVVWQSVDQRGKTFNDAPGAPTPQYSFEGYTREDGELTWTEAPADEVLMSFLPKNHGQVHNLLLSANSSVQIVTLTNNYPPQAIRGTVHDAITGRSVSPIRVRKGYPREKAGVVTPVWYSSFRDIVDFDGGTFKFEFQYTPEAEPSRFQYMFEVSAEGYEPAISRVVRGDEGDVDLEFALQPATISAR